MIKFISALLVLAVAMIFVVGLSDRQEQIRPQGRIINVHLGPRMFYNVEYVCCDENGIEEVNVIDWVFWRKSYKIKNFAGHWMVKFTETKACMEMECWDPLEYYERIPAELRRHIEYARQRAKEAREIRSARSKAS